MSVHAITMGQIDLPINKIYACQTQQDTIGKNVTQVFVKDDEHIYRIPSPLRGLFAKIDDPSFLWVDKNVFIHKNHIQDPLEIKLSAKVTLYGNQFKVSRRKMKQFY